MKWSIAIVLFLISVTASAHDHPAEHAQLHETFYRDLRQPDHPGYGCCNDHDCYPTQVRFENGYWHARRREDGRWLVVPQHKIITDRKSPDGKAHICAPAPAPGVELIPGPVRDSVLCFIPPEADT